MSAGSPGSEGVSGIGDVGAAGVLACNEGVAVGSDAGAGEAGVLVGTSAVVQLTTVRASQSQQATQE